jgi:nucleoside-diphosphate-sugar epimerase
MTNANSTQRILITGGLGFIGFHLARRLSAEPGTEVVLVDNLVRGRLDADAEALLALPNVSFLEGDLTDPACIASLGTGYAEIYHFAAVIGVSNVLKHPDRVLRVNAMSTLLLLDWFVAGGADRFLFPSTSEAYAWTQHVLPLPVPTPETVPLAITDVHNPRASYAGSKIFCELAVAQYGAQHGKPVAIVRYHNVYGPRMGTQHVIPELYYRAAFERQDPLVVYSPDHSRAFCYVDDAVTATMAATRLPEAAGGIFNIGNASEEITIRDLASKILTLSGRADVIDGRTAENDPVQRRCPDVSHAKKVLGYTPEVSLEEGLRRTLAWYEEYYRRAR